MRELKIGDTIRIRKTPTFEPIRTDEEWAREWGRAACRVLGGYDPQLEPTELFTIQNEDDLKKARELVR